MQGCFGLNGEIISGSENGELVVWDVGSKDVIQRWQGHNDVVLGVDFCRTDGRKLASCSADGSVKLWRGVSSDEEAPGNEDKDLMAIDSESDI
jgi:WD40 repeat protein